MKNVPAVGRDNFSCPADASVRSCLLGGTELGLQPGPDVLFDESRVQVPWQFPVNMAILRGVTFDIGVGLLFRVGHNLDAAVRNGIKLRA